MRTLLSLIAALMPALCFAQGQQQCQDEQRAMNEIGTKYKPIFDGYEKEGEDLKGKAVDLKIKVTWKDEEIIFDTPSVTIKDQRLVFGVPQVTMRTQEITFGTPSVRMKRVKTGQYPEFYCDTHTVIPKCTTRWSDTFADVPEPFLEQQHIKLDLPEFKWADTEIIMGIPEFFMQRQRWVIGLPQFELDSIYLNSGELKKKGEELQGKVAATRAEQVKDTGSAIHNLYGCYRNGISAQKQQASVTFNTALAQLDGIIQGLKSQGADPTKLTASDGTTTDLVQKRTELASKKDEALTKFDSALKLLDDSEKDAMAKLQS